DGAKVVHGGELGMAIDSAVQEAGGFLTIDDLRKNRAEWSSPVSINYRGYQVIASAAPTNGWNALLRLGIMSRFSLSGHNTAVYLHRYAEVTKLAYAARLKYAGDPDVSPPPLAKVLSEKYWAEEAAKINSQRAMPLEVSQDLSNREQHTTHFVVADRWGNVV